MKLVASLIGRNESGRYLNECIAHLLEFVDEICVVDDASSDGTVEWLASLDRVAILQLPEPRFYIHEGQARQVLIDFTLARGATHVLSVDFDEFVTDGQQLRARLEEEPEHLVWSLEIAEVWKANEHLWVREDGGWRTHGLPILWKAPPAGTRWTMLNRKLACRRVPEQVLAQGARAKPVGSSLLHFGWTRPGERKARYDRYAKHDGGRFHAGSHLRSILWPDQRVKLQWRDWPEGAVFDQLREGFMIPA